jgi:hypothetical protein
MIAKLVKRAREFRPDWNVLSDERGMASVLIAEMADRIEALERERDKMLEALKEAVDCDGLRGPAETKALAAIAKAEGKE